MSAIGSPAATARAASAPGIRPAVDQRRAPTRIFALVIMVTLIVLVSACGDLVSGSGTTVTKQFVFQGFTRIDISTAFDVTVTRAAAFTVSASFDENLAQYLKVELDGQTLHVGLQEGNSYSDTHLKASIALPELDGLSMSGASSARISGLHSDRGLEIGLSGASSVVLDDVRSGETSFHLSGAARVTGTLAAASAAFDLSGGSRVTLSGATATASLDASGGAGLDLRDFTAERLSARMSGGANAKVTVGESLDADLSGGSDLEYFGHPALGDVNTSGGSHVHAAGSR